MAVSNSCKYPHVKNCVKVESRCRTWENACYGTDHNTRNYIIVLNSLASRLMGNHSSRWGKDEINDDDEVISCVDDRVWHCISFVLSFLDTYCSLNSQEREQKRKRNKKNRTRSILRKTEKRNQSSMCALEHYRLSGLHNPWGYKTSSFLGLGWMLGHLERSRHPSIAHTDTIPSFLYTTTTSFNTSFTLLLLRCISSAWHRFEILVSLTRETISIYII